jgi:hypothetical protein
MDSPMVHALQVVARRDFILIITLANPKPALPELSLAMWTVHMRRPTVKLRQNLRPATQLATAIHMALVQLPAVQADIIFQVEGVLLKRVNPPRVTAL